MENNGILNIIANLAKSLSGKNGENNKENEKNDGNIKNKSSPLSSPFSVPFYPPFDGKKIKNENSPNENYQNISNENSFEEVKNNGSSNCNSQTDNSFLKSYNPIKNATLKSAQIISQKTAKPCRTSIDLKKSKNLAGGEKSSNENNIVDLIKRHNSFIEKINNKKP